jgi:hypothetical protein
LEIWLNIIKNGWLVHEGQYTDKGDFKDSGVSRINWINPNAKV